MHCCIFTDFHFSALAQLLNDLRIFEIKFIWRRSIVQTQQQQSRAWTKLRRHCDLLAHRPSVGSFLHVQSHSFLLFKCNDMRLIGILMIFDTKFSYVAVFCLLAHFTCSFLCFFCFFISLNRMRKSAFRFTSKLRLLSYYCWFASLRPLVGHIKSAFSWSTARKDVLWISWILNWNLTRIDRKFCGVVVVLHTSSLLFQNWNEARETGQNQERQNITFLHNENNSGLVYWSWKQGWKLQNKVRWCTIKLKKRVWTARIVCVLVTRCDCGSTERVYIPRVKRREEKPKNQTIKLIYIWNENFGSTHKIHLS